jgi:hypothetical protein
MAIIHSKPDPEGSPPLKKGQLARIKHTELVNIGVKLLKNGKLPHKWKYNLSDSIPAYKGTEQDKVIQCNGKIGRCQPIFAEPQNLSGLIPDVIGWTWGNSVVIEAKTSRSDFLNDTRKKNYEYKMKKRVWDGTRGKKAFAGVYYFYLTYPNMIKPEELTWQGLVTYNPETKEIIKVKPAEFREDYTSQGTEVCVLLSGMRGRNTPR